MLNKEKESDESLVESQGHKGVLTIFNFWSLRACFRQVQIIRRSIFPVKLQSSAKYKEIKDRVLVLFELKSR